MASGLRLQTASKAATRFRSGTSVEERRVLMQTFHTSRHVVPSLSSRRKDLAGMGLAGSERPCLHWHATNCRTFVAHLQTRGSESRRGRGSGERDILSYGRLHAAFPANSFSSSSSPSSTSSSSWIVNSSETASIQEPGSTELPAGTKGEGGNDLTVEEVEAKEGGANVTEDQVVPALRNLKLASGAWVLPHPDKVYKGGEDAFFIARHHCAVGVADGVGGWAELGVDPGLYARELMERVRHAIDEGLPPSPTPSPSQSPTAGKEGAAAAAAGAVGAADVVVPEAGGGSLPGSDSDSDSSSSSSVLASGSASSSSDSESGEVSSASNGSSSSSGGGGRKMPIHPMQGLLKAHAATTSEGSSTACVVMLSQNSLVAANVGDSGFLIVRSGRAIFKSPPQQHDFNFPYQLGSEGGDHPTLAQVFNLPVAAGDVIVLGTDGLFDNVFDPEVAALVSASLQAGLDPQAAAQRIAAVAQMRAKDRLYRSPFARAAEAAGYYYIGGKLDDITVVVSYVVSD